MIDGVIIRGDLLHTIDQELKQDRHSITHILTINIGPAKTGAYQEFFKKIANKEFRYPIRNEDGQPINVQITWLAPGKRQSSRIFFTKSIFSDFVVAEATKLIFGKTKQIYLKAFADEIQVNPTSFLITKPLNLTSKDKSPKGQCIHESRKWVQFDHYWINSKCL